MNDNLVGGFFIGGGGGGYMDGLNFVNGGIILFIVFGGSFNILGGGVGDGIMLGGGGIVLGGWLLI